MNKQQLRQRNDGLRQLQNAYGEALRDEEQAAKMYGNLISSAQNKGFLTGETQARQIREQELHHAETLKKLSRALDVEIAENEKAATRLEEEERKKSQVKDPNRRYGR